MIQRIHQDGEVRYVRRFPDGGGELVPTWFVRAYHVALVLFVFGSGTALALIVLGWLT